VQRSIVDQTCSHPVRYVSFVDWQLFLLLHLHCFIWMGEIRCGRTHCLEEPFDELGLVASSKQEIEVCVYAP
jgi:hypothetical protein